MRDHTARDEDGHFISGNLRDFAPAGTLHQRLLVDLGEGVKPLHYYTRVSEFLAVLGEATDTAAVELELLAERATPTLRVVLPVSLHVPLAVFGAEEINDFRYHTKFKDARPLEVLATRHYSRGEEALTVVDSRWRLNVDCFRQPVEDESDSWSGYEDVPLVGSIQLYLPVADEQAPLPLPQIVSARFETDHWIGI